MQFGQKHSFEFRTKFEHSLFVQACNRLEPEKDSSYEVWNNLSCVE